MAIPNESEAPARTQDDPNVTWEDTAKHIGEDYSGGIIMVADERVDKVIISRYCEPAEIGNLTYWDEEVARMAGYRSQVVPWAMVKEVPTYSGNWRPGQSTRFPLDPDVDVVIRWSNIEPPGDLASGEAVGASGGRFRKDLYRVRHENLVNGRTYHYSIFSVDRSNNASTPVHASATPADVLPPAVDLCSFEVTRGDAISELQWSSRDGDYAGVRIRSSTVAAPTTSASL